MRINNFFLIGVLGVLVFSINRVEYCIKVVGFNVYDDFKMLIKYYISLNY